MKTTNILSVVLLSGAVIVLPSGVASAQPAIIVDAPKAEKKVCRRDHAVGTRLARPLCLTKAEWKRYERQGDEFKTRLQHNNDSRASERHPYPGTPTGSGG